MSLLSQKLINQAKKYGLYQSSMMKRGFMEWTTSAQTIRKWTKNETLVQWILDYIRLMQPSKIHLCDGTEEENEMLIKKMVHSGTLIPLNPKLRPNSYLARSTPNDTARVEDNTFICSEHKNDAGPTNNWNDPLEMQRKLKHLFQGVMRGRTMYVIPFSMAPVSSPFAQFGVQITDSPYVVVNMRMMTHGMGTKAFEALSTDHPFIPCVHTVGQPLGTGQEDQPWPCNSKEKYIVHFPESRQIWSYGSGYGGNALLGKKCLALRIASNIGREEGWLAEHMLIVGITAPWGKKYYIAGAFPSACGKTNLAMLRSSLPGWKVEMIGDDICWMRIGEDGRLWAVNPEAGCFGVAPGTSTKSNYNCMESLKSNVIFTNCAMTKEGDVWWEGMTEEVPEGITTWKRTEYFLEAGMEAAHPNARFTVPTHQVPCLDKEWLNPKGVPISAILFGSRRSNTIPLIYESNDWNHGVFVGATMNSETTAAAAGKRGVLRNDPFAMKPFCGYNMSDYFKHWISFKNRTDPAKLPKIFHVNWFRKTAGGKFIWPGFGENIRAIEWILKRCENENNKEIYVDSPIGKIPSIKGLNLSGLNITQETFDELMKVDKNDWLGEVKKSKEFFSTFEKGVPQELNEQLEALQKRLESERH